MNLYEEEGQILDLLTKACQMMDRKEEVYSALTRCLRNEARKNGYCRMQGVCKKETAACSSDAVGFDVAVHHGVDGQGGNGMDVEFLHDVLAVGDDGGGADIEAVGDFLVGQSAHDEDKHLDFPCGKPVGVACRTVLVLLSGHALGQPTAVGMGVLLQLQQGAGQRLFALVDVQGVEVGRLGRTGRAVGQDDGFGFSLHEEGAVLEQHLRRDEVVEIHVRRVADQLFEGVEGAHRGEGHHPFDEPAQPDAGQRVGVYDGDFR